MFRIFISYNNENREIVKTLADDIAALGHQVWLDRELTGGQAWWDQILAEIRQCHVFVFALSPEALDSYPCKLEHEYASSLNKSILPNHGVRWRLGQSAAAGAIETAAHRLPPLNRNVREFSVTNVMSRSWQMSNPESDQLVHIAKEILDAVKVIAPKHKVVTARREGE